jgi:hypothetical protein
MLWSGGITEDFAALLQPRAIEHLRDQPAR